MNEVGQEVFNRELWVPASVKERSEREAAQTITEYDDSLILGFRKDVQEWVVFLRNGPHGAPFPVLGLGRTLPPREEIQRKLYKADTKRRGPAIVAEVERHNRQIEEAGKKRSAAALEVAAEGMEWFARKEGLRGNGKVFIPKGLTRER